MNRSTIVPFVLILFLPLLVMQLRMAFYKKSESLGDFRQALLEGIPHDLSIIGFTLGIVAQTTALSGVLPSGYGLWLMYFAWAPFAIAALLPLISSRLYRLIMGVLAYLVGAACYFVAAAQGWLT